MYMYNNQLLWWSTVYCIFINAMTVFLQTMRFICLCVILKSYRIGFHKLILRRYSGLLVKTVHVDALKIQRKQMCSWYFFIIWNDVITENVHIKKQMWSFFSASNGCKPQLQTLIWVTASLVSTVQHLTALPTSRTIWVIVTVSAIASRALKVALLVWTRTIYKVISDWSTSHEMSGSNSNVWQSS